MIRWVFALLLVAGPCFCTELPQPKNCDGKTTDLHPKGKITVVMASSQPLAEKTREFGRAMYPWQGLEDFRVIVVVDLRKSLGTLFKGWTVGKMKADLDEEAWTLQPWFRNRGNTNNPRPYLCAVPDFDGKTTEALGWGGNHEIMKVAIFGKDGELLWSDQDAKNPSSLSSKLWEQLGPPAPTPPSIEPRQSRILRRPQ
ncbi:MAG: hypothetical protein EBT68_00805 [Verrucomicrobia bacterium]|nr:hypothetical protein [Verrucomicrobiota bacterium]